MVTTSEHEMLLPEIIDHRAKVSPNRTFAFLPKGQELEDGFFPLTYSVLAKAVDATTFWLDQEIKQSEDGSTQTVPYIGANDFRYILLFYACLKSERIFMTPLTFNTTVGLVKLIANYKTVLTCEGHHHHWEGAREQISDLRIVEMPSIEAFIHNDPVPKYSYTRTNAESINSVAYRIQSSGTTGSPKPIDVMMQEVHNMPLAKANEEAGEHEKFAMPELFGNGCYTPNLLPLSWAAGLMFSASVPLGIGNIPIMLPSTAPQPMTPEYVIRLNKLAPRGEKNGLNWIPSGLRQLVKDPAGLEGLKHYDWVAYAGAPLDHETGDLISSFTRVQSLMGDTSVGLTPLLLNDTRDWKIHRVSTYLGYFFDKFFDDLYELCIRRQPQDYRPCFRSDPTVEVYHTRDLWRKVENRPGFWETAGRMDDFVKLSSMTKFNAIEFEHKLERHPGVVRALVAGDGRPKPFAIVELDAISSRQSSREIVVGAIGIANVNVWEEVQLRKDLIIVADAARLIRRTDKGSTDRRSTIAIYSKEIEELYRKAGLA